MTSRISNGNKEEQTMMKVVRELVKEDADFFKMYLCFADFALKFLDDFFSLRWFNL